MFDRSIPEPNTGCWLWTGAVLTGCYASIKVAGKSTVASRYVFETLNGTLGDDLQVDHKCYVRLCINPDHLQAVTPKENMRRRRPAGSFKFVFNYDKDYRAKCKRGHEFDSLYPNGSRRCRQCDALRTRNAYWRKKRAA